MTFGNASPDLFSFFYNIYFQKILKHFKIKLLRKLSLVGLTCITGLQWNHEVTIRNSPKILIKEIKDIGQKNSFSFFKELYFGMLHQNCLEIESGVSWRGALSPSSGIMEWQWEISPKYFSKMKYGVITKWHFWRSFIVKYYIRKDVHKKVNHVNLVSYLIVPQLL